MPNQQCACCRRMWIRVLKHSWPLSELRNVSQKKQRTRVKPTEPKTYATNRSQWPVFLCLRGVCCVKSCAEDSGCKSTEFAQRHGREGIKLMGQKFFDMHESSRVNTSFKMP